MNGRRGTTVIIGNFDGVHIGHVELIRRAHAAARDGRARVVALTFDPHPLTRVQPNAAPARLTTFERRSALLTACGVDEVIRLQPSAALLGLTPEEFVEHIVRDLQPEAIVEGQDFRFGKGRSGDVETLRRLGARHGFSVHIVPPIEAVMTDGLVAPASSTLARWLVAHGRMRDAVAVLGREYEVEGTVERGDQRGRQLGYPTANVETECLLPGDGVYAGWAVLPDEREVPAAISVGAKPMFGGARRLLEAHLLGEPDLSPWPEYGWPIRVRVSRWLRDQMVFESVESLIRQVEADCRRAMPGGAVTT